MPTGKLQAQTCWVSVLVERWEAKGCPPAGEKPPVLKQGPWATPIGCNFYGQKLPCAGSLKKPPSARNTPPFSATQPPLPSFLVTRFLTLRPKHVKPGQRMETEGARLTTLWVVAFHLNCYLHPAGCLAKKEGESSEKRLFVFRSGLRTN